MGPCNKQLAPALGLGASLLLGLWLWGFSVDDALISARYAHHIALGQGPRFNLLQPATDGVTPLLWPWLLAPFSYNCTLSGWQAARWLGLGAWAIASTLLCWHLSGLLRGKALGWQLAAMLVGVGTPAVHAWAGAGMETGLVTALATSAAVLAARRPFRILALGLIGLCPTFRPEMLPWALVMGWGTETFFDAHEGAPQGLLPRGKIASALLVALPFALIALARKLVFGAFAPLAVQAKPSDLHHGLVYVAAALVVTGPCAAVLAPRGWSRLSRWPKTILAAAAVHLLVLVAVGGDWMPLSRLLVPVLPTLSIVFAHLLAVTPTWSTAGRLVLCALAQLYVLLHVGPEARRVVRDRRALIAQLRPLLRETDHVAALDVGWVGASFEGPVLDLAGLTDPAIAALAGGHTSKRVSAGILADRKATHLLLLLPQGFCFEEAWEKGFFARKVESDLSRQPWVREHFFLVRELTSTGQLRYALLVRKPP